MLYIFQTTLDIQLPKDEIKSLHLHIIREHMGHTVKWASIAQNLRLANVQ